MYTRVTGPKNYALQLYAKNKMLMLLEVHFQNFIW